MLSLFRHSLVRELAIVLAIKFLLLILNALWFELDADKRADKTADK